MSTSQAMFTGSALPESRARCKISWFASMKHIIPFFFYDQSGARIPLPVGCLAPAHSPSGKSWTSELFNILRVAMADEPYQMITSSRLALLGIPVPYTTAGCIGVERMQALWLFDLSLGFISVRSVSIQSCCICSRNSRKRCLHPDWRKWKNTDLYSCIQRLRKRGEQSVNSINLYFLQKGARL